MQTELADFIRDTPEGREADAILRKCVHCGFCTATCPTYQLLGDELDGPRGRIYLVKQVLEGGSPSGKTRLHLDRCLTCRACETTCPSGVQYGRLADIGRGVVEARTRRGTAERALRAARQDKGDAKDGTKTNEQPKRKELFPNVVLETQGEVRRVGDNHPVKVSGRLVAATDPDRIESLMRSAIAP